jgi:hypothetical protein
MGKREKPKPLNAPIAAEMLEGHPSERAAFLDNPKMLPRVPVSQLVAAQRAKEEASKEARKGKA